MFMPYVLGAVSLIFSLAALLISLQNYSNYSHEIRRENGREQLIKEYLKESVVMYERIKDVEEAVFGEDGTSVGLEKTRVMIEAIYKTVLYNDLAGRVRRLEEAQDGELELETERESEDEE